MKVEGELEIGDVVYTLRERENSIKTYKIQGIKMYIYGDSTQEMYITDPGSLSVDSVYYKTEKDAKIALAERILNSIEKE